MTDYDLLLEHFENPRNTGVIDDADGVGVDVNPVCGDTMRLTLRIRQGQVQDVRHQTVGCTAAVASASVATELVLGRPVSEVERLTRDDIAAALGGLPPSKLHGPVLVADALHKALADFRRRQEDGGYSEAHSEGRR